MIQVERDIRVRSLIIGNKVAFARAIILSSLFNFYYFFLKKKKIYAYLYQFVCLDQDLELKNR